MSILNTIRGPEDVKALNKEDLNDLAQDIRETIIQTISQNGGHIGPNLGVVELSIALHRVFSTPKDKFIFDVSHQGYVHKLLTGRNGPRFEKIRQTGGISGFLDHNESIHDAFGAGHAGTALSAALGMATARDVRGSDEHVVAIAGDGAFTCGITMEALNNIAHCTKRFTIILNDNKWSIARNVGAIANYLNKLITCPEYNRFNAKALNLLAKIPGGGHLKRFLSKAKRETKDFFVSSNLFEAYGLRYIGPIDGHDIDQLITYLEFCKQSEKPVLLHVITEKGKGYPGALENPEKFHGPGPFDITTGKSKPSKPGTPPKYQDVFGEAIVRLGTEDPRILAITAATPLGSGLSNFSKLLPGQFFDVGTAEEHAVLFAAGLAKQGLKPVCAIYSTFLQRAFDQIVHDVCLQNLPVTFCMDRAGLSANDGPTHHGLFDIAYLRPIPHATLMQPKDEDELVDMFYTSLELGSPAFIRYPRGSAMGVAIKSTPQELEIGRAECLRTGKDITLWALGPFVYEALDLAEKLYQEHRISVGVVNARFIKPLDKELLISQAKTSKLIVTLEDHAVSSGFGSAVLEVLQEENLSTPVERIGWPDTFIPHASNNEDLRAQHDLSPEAIQKRILARWKNLEPKEETPTTPQALESSGVCVS
ncbi:MAG TPA: 1-deoxy-D-xylulose-5-phosphate synthase [Opitutae bacterium]|nr:1-deoxy-D-xylulose-5-phosphate synthase [Opitutae bacterium]